MNVIGIAVISLASFLLLKGYTDNISRRALEYEEIYKLLCHIKHNLNDTGKSLLEAIDGFSSEELKSSGMIEILRESTGTNSHGWRDRIKQSRLSVDGEDCERIISYFSSFGKSGAEEELAALSDTLSYFEGKLNNVKVKSDKDIKVAWILFTTAFVSALIMIL